MHSRKQNVPDFNVIANVTQTLTQFLTARLMTVDPTAIAEEHDLTAPPTPNPPKVSVFLFEVNEDPSSRNRPRVRESATGGLVDKVRIKKPPIALQLRYLFTPWSGDRLTDQKLLGLVVRTFYDNAIISGADLKGAGQTANSGLVGSDEALKLTLSPLTLEERTRIWHAVQQKYRLSVTYETRVVKLESEISTESTTVRHRSFEFGEPDVVS